MVAVAGEDKEVRRGGKWCTRHETRRRRAEKQEGSKAKLGEESVTCVGAWNEPSTSGGFGGGAARW